MHFCLFGGTLAMLTALVIALLMIVFLPRGGGGE
jgi:hypothetical protein